MSANNKDRPTKWIKCGSSAGKSSLVKDWINPTGIPEKLVVDRSQDFLPESVSSFYSNILKKLGQDDKSRGKSRERKQVKILVQRVEFDEEGNPVLVYDSLRIEPPSTRPIKKGSPND